MLVTATFSNEYQISGSFLSLDLLRNVSHDPDGLFSYEIDCW